MWKKFRNMTLVLVLCVSLTLSACQAKKKKIAYTIYPVEYLLKMLGQEHLDMVSIQKEKALNVQSSTRSNDTNTILSQVGIYFHIGSLEPYGAVLKEELESQSHLKKIDLSNGNAVYEFGRYRTELKNGKEVTQVESYYDDSSFQLVDTNKRDLNLWLVPITMLSMAKTIHQNLEELYPENKKLYDQHLASLEYELINLDAKYQDLANQLVKENKRIAFVSVTSSFGAWQKAYGFEVYPLVLSKYGVLPNEEQLAFMEKKIKENKVHYIVHEENLSKEMEILYQRVKEDLDLKEVSLSNLSSKPSADKKKQKDYISVMYENYSHLVNIVESK
ncbi:MULTISPECIES: metal ABC transporter solute-binding protein, Zn/Mn family [Terrabacteria group]|uniref:metal ABC transporter substrate-binding protein n=1 Tax=Bacillati TaxID=1783272 RepID=UPI00193A2C8B|nr:MULTISPECIES: zinc ABC transporter substrate-binding protein [Terrabacteria group]MBW9212034.1 zinc ABC transporter substrate-binding protein [Trueperella sp. zg.1013]QRG87159.1 zinc ABC transporter substrate-binding protein [Bulleidia sp. zg-1006]